LTLTYPQAGVNTKLDRILIGMHDYGTGLDMPTFKVTADFEAGENLAPNFKLIAANIWELRFTKPPASLPRANL